MKIYKLARDIDFDLALNDIGVDLGSINILKNKMKYHLIKIENIYASAANILKQDALSIGAELATPRGIINCEKKYVDVILMGTSKHLKILSKKELAQPFGLKMIAKQLGEFIKSSDYDLQIMGIINVNDDSFFPASCFKSTKAIDKINNMICHGANIIDIGGVSSRPGSILVSSKEEMQRLKPIIDPIFNTKLYKKAHFSIDSYTPHVINYALSHGFTIVNDITGLASNEVCEIVAKHKAKVVIMHMQGKPQNMQDNPFYENVITEIYDFFKERIKKAHSFGIKDIILDVGIGFGKKLEHNLMLIKHLEHFKNLNFPLLIGGSRKSIFDLIKPTPVQERLSATLALHIQAVNRGASIIRCHDVKEHKQAFSVIEALRF